MIIMIRAMTKAIGSMLSGIGDMVLDSSIELGTLVGFEDGWLGGKRGRFCCEIDSFCILVLWRRYGWVSEGVGELHGRLGE